MDKIRLQKFFTDCGIMSRRAAESEIECGNVTVNGIKASLGDKVDPEVDVVEWNGKIIKSGALHRTYLMVNKPMGYVTTMSDEKGRKIAAELVGDCGTRVYPIGRLDMYSEGLLLFTDDGELANKLTHPSHNICKLYLVKVKGSITKDQLSILTSPMELDGYKLRPIDVKVVKKGAIDSDGNEYSTLRITLYEGRNRQIRRMCEKSGIVIMRLKRIAIGDINIGKLEVGKWRYLTQEEIDYLINN